MKKNLSVKRLECDGKRSYATWADANTAAQTAALRVGHMHAYKCNFCKRFHVASHSSQTQRLEPYHRHGRRMEEAFQVTQ